MAVHKEQQDEQGRGQTRAQGKRGRPTYQKSARVPSEADQPEPSVDIQKSEGASRESNPHTPWLWTIGKDKTPLPVFAKGQGELALRMMEGIPIMHNMSLTRSLYAEGTEDSYIP